MPLRDAQAPNVASGMTCTPDGSVYAYSVAVMTAKYAGAPTRATSRLYEATGGRSRVRLEASFAEVAEEVDLLERPLAESRVVLAPDGDRAWTFEVRPFQLVTVRLRRRLR